MLETSNFVYGSATWSLTIVMSECSLSGRGQSREQFLYCGLRKFRHSKSSVYRWYPQLVRGRFVNDTYKTMEATRSRHGWVHMFMTHRPTVTLQLHNFDLFRLVVQVVSALLRGNWQDFNWHDASRGPSAIAELLVLSATLRSDSAVQCHLSAWLFCEGGGGVTFIPAWFLYFSVLHSLA